jgi:muramidase (phage lysozyme)
VRIALYLITLVAVAIVLAGNDLAGATTYESACSVTEAHARVHKAARALHRAEARLAEARRILTATRGYSALYGGGVGRWTWLSRQVGWPWGCFPTLMMIISRESGGNPAAKNPTSTASGLLQFLADWWYGHWNPFNPRSNLRAGYRAWTKVRWQPWAL